MSCGTTGASAARWGSMDMMLLYQYACACGQPVISGLPAGRTAALLKAPQPVVPQPVPPPVPRVCLCWCLRVLSGSGFGLRFGAAGSVGTSCLALFLLPESAVSGSGASVWRSVRLFLRLLHLRLVFGRLHLINVGKYNTNDKDDPRSRLGQAEAHVPQGNQAPEAALGR